MRSIRVSSGILLALAVLIAGLTVATVPAAEAATSAPTATRKAVNKKQARPFFRMCHKSKRFAERRFDFSVDAVLGGRCALRRIRGIKLISSYNGHHPSASKALDIMINMSGSCRAGRDTGNAVARYFMNHARQHKVRYIIWKNSYWASTSSPKRHRHWRHGITGGSCTTKHYDHVHVAFR